MEKLLGFRTLLSMLVLAMACFMISSCGDDDVEGCTDVDAENYDVNATVDSGNCIYARDEFLGDYIGMFTCPGALAFIGSDSLAFSIEPSLNAADKSGVLLNLTLAASPIPIALEGTVSDGTLSIASTLEDITVPNVPVIGTLTTDVTGTGTATIDANGNLNGTVTVSVDTPFGPITETCTLTGMPQ